MASSNTRSNSTFPCAQCNHVYPQMFSLTNHIKTEHNSNFECYNCGSIAKTAIGLMQHMKLHVKKDNVKEEKKVPLKTNVEQKENPLLKNIKIEKNVSPKISTKSGNDQKLTTKDPAKKINLDPNDPTIPKGWKISTNYEFKLYLSPTGRFFKSRELAYASMIEDGSHSAEDLHLMKTGEKSDWVESPNIPEGWKISIGDGVGKGERFKSPDGVFIFQSRKDACNYMLQKGGYSSKDIDLMSQKIANTKKQSDWLENDPTVPSGWKIKTTEVKLKNGVSKKEMFKFNKKVFDSRQAAFAYMVACRSYSSEDLELMKTGVKTKWEDHDESMPKGWKIRTSNNGKIFWFKSPDGKILYSRESAFMHMIKKGGFSEEDINLMKTGLPNVPQLIKKYSQPNNELENVDIKPKIAWSSCEGKLPNGWKMRITEKKRTIYLSPDKNTLSSLMQCLQFMIKRKYANKDIQLMAKNLPEEGWEVNKNIPKGWYMKKDREGVSFNFLTDEFKLILGVPDALNFMTNSDKYNNIEMERLLILVKLVSSSSSSAQSAKLANIPAANNPTPNITTPSIPAPKILDPHIEYQKELAPSTSESFSDSITEEAIPLIPEIPSLLPSASLKKCSDQSRVESGESQNYDDPNKTKSQPTPSSFENDTSNETKRSFGIKTEKDPSATHSNDQHYSQSNVDSNEPVTQCDSNKNPRCQPTAISDEPDQQNSHTIADSDEIANHNTLPTLISDKTDQNTPLSTLEPSEISDKIKDNTHHIKLASSIMDQTDKLDINRTTELSDETGKQGDKSGSKSIATDGEPRAEFTPVAASSLTSSQQTASLVPGETVLSTEVSEGCIKPIVPNEDKITETDQLKSMCSRKRKTEIDDTEGRSPKRKAAYEETFKQVATHENSQLFCYEFLTDEHESNFIKIVTEFKAALANDNEE